MAAIVVACSGKAGTGDPKGSDGGVTTPPASSFTPQFSRAWPADELASALSEGRAVITHHQCNRCHVIDDIPAADKSFHCTSCHVWLKGMAPGETDYQKLSQKYGEPVLKRYQHNIEHLQRVPDLTGVARRVKPSWITSFLAQPEDLRPALNEAMIRHRLDASEIEKVVRYFAARAGVQYPRAGAPDSTPIDTSKVEAGKQLFLTRGCVTCHTFGNLATGMSANDLHASITARLAPNLRFARARMDRETAVEWILDPVSILPTTLMPRLPVDRGEAESIVAFLWTADPALEPEPAAPAPYVPAVLDRKVPYAEMKERVLGKVCVHCHMNDYERDTGAGNNGGFGYKGIRLRMRTYETLVSGAVDAEGKPYSVLVARAGEKVPPILEAMIKRRDEERRDHVEAFHDHVRPSYPAGSPGMPLGLPAMTDDEMSILATWIAQGCEGPDVASGMAGVWDGYLVPDGPIEKNKGCEVRAPSAHRPEWAVDRTKEGVVPAPSPSGSSLPLAPASGSAAPHGSTPHP